MLKQGWRWWHSWLGFGLLIPFLVVAVTAVLIAHEGVLRWKQVPIAAGWLPGYAGEAEGPELRAVHRLADGREYVATKVGLFLRHGAELSRVTAVGTSEFRAVATRGETVAAAGKSGLWIGDGGAWRRVLKGEVWAVEFDPEGGIIAASKEQGIMRSADAGQSWRRDDALHDGVARTAGDLGGHTLGTLVVDLHTGRALFGKAWEWIWIDVVSLPLIFLSVSGLILWWRPRRRRILAAAGGRRQPISRDRPAPQA